MSNTLRQQIGDNIELALRGIRDPKPVLITGEPFDVAKLAITQFPALLISFQNEERQTITMGMQGVGRRQGMIEFEIRGYVRGTELDKRRSDLMAAIEQALDEDRYLGLQAQGVTDSQVKTLAVTSRIPPLAEFTVTFQVHYNYVRGTQ